MVDFRNTLIVLTSNLGSELLAAHKADEELSGHDRDQIMGVVRKHFRPEFLNRLDEILIFNRLGKKHMHRIVDIQIARLAARLADRNIALTLENTGRDWLADVGYDPMYGARPLKRVIQRSLENSLAQMILEGKVQDGDEVLVSANKDGIIITAERSSGTQKNKKKTAS